MIINTEEDLARAQEYIKNSNIEEVLKQVEVSKEFDKPLIVDLDTEEGEKLAEAYRRGYADGYHEGVYDGENK